MEAPTSPSPLLIPSTFSFRFTTPILTMSSITFTTLILLATVFTLSQFPITTTASDILAPLFAPVFRHVCDGVGCGKGKCKMSETNDLMYECECDPGWKQTIFTNDTSGLKFLPCVIPNCTLDHSCSKDAPTAQPGNNFSNASIFEPCRWAICGGGVCNKKSGLTYACNCNEGFDNLLNNTAFPCFKECSFGGDCSNLGLTLPNNTSTTAVSPSSLSDSSTNKAKSLQHEALYNAMIVVAISVVPLFYRL